jgi:DnaA family protein
LSDLPQQLHLPVGLIREPTLAEYLPGPNAEAAGAVAAAAAGTGEPFLLLIGQPGTGKTHLLQGACLEAAARGRQAHYCPLGLAGLLPSILDDLERLDLVAIDDLDRAAGDPSWELALFDLFNRLRERGRTLLAAAATGPDQLPIGLPDLRSRLHWGPRYRLLPLAEADCERLLADCARRLGLALGPESVRAIMTHHARDPASLVGLLARIDSASLAEQRPPNIHLVRRVLRGEPQ